MKLQVAYLLLIPGSVTPVNIVLHVSPFLSWLCEKKDGESPVQYSLPRFIDKELGLENKLLYSRSHRSFKGDHHCNTSVFFPPFLSLLQVLPQSTVSMDWNDYILLVIHTHCSAVVPMRQKWRIVFPPQSLELAEDSFQIRWEEEETCMTVSRVTRISCC